MGCKCDVKRWILGGLVVAVSYWVLDYVVHHVFLMGLYQSTMHLWRPMEQAQSLMKFTYVGYLLFGFLFMGIYSFGYEGGKPSWGQGARYGFWMGLLYWGTRLMLMVAFVPYPKSLYAAWLIGGMIQFIILGMIAGLLYRPRTAGANA